MERTRLIQLAALALALVFLAASAFLAHTINQQRRQLDLTHPPQLEQVRLRHTASTLANASLGAFRGLAADILWYRANRLKMEGKFHEANQTAELITALQPSFASVWVFHAWNMAYNISVATYTVEERWDWVSKGIRLLRDKAIPLNPKMIILYRELGWFFFHKIGGVADDAHWFYKRMLALEWQELLGTPAEAATSQQAAEAFRPIAEAPETLAEIVQSNPDVQPLVDAFDRLGYRLDEHLLRQIGRILMFSSSPDARALGLSAKALPARLDPRLVDLVNSPDNKPALDAFLAFLRKKVLRETYHMDPSFMLQLMLPQDQDGYGFGPLDWRHYAAHALYWPALGVRQAASAKLKEHPQKVDLLNTYRATIHAFQALTDSGRVNFDSVTGRLDLLPDPRFIPAYEKAFEVALEDLQRQNYRQNPADMYAAGHENFLLKAVVFCYLYGNRQDAERYYTKLREKYGNKPENLESGIYLQPLEDLVLQQLSQNADLMAFARQFIDAMLLQAFHLGLANGRADVYDRFVELARRVHQRHQASAPPNPRYEEQRRLAFLPFDQVLTESYLGFMQAPPPSSDQIAETVLHRSRIWRNSPLWLQQRVYDRFRPTIQAMCQSLNLDPALAFPPPPQIQEKSSPSEPTEKKATLPAAPARH